MTPTRFFLSQQLIPGLINAALNGGIAWAQHAQSPAVGLWDRGAYGTDLLATGFLLPAISWLILLPLLQHQRTQGKAPSLDGLRRPRLLAWMPSSRWGGCLTIGLLGMVLLGGTAALAASLLGQPAFTGPDYAWLKAAYAAILTLTLQPTMVFAALRPAHTKGQPIRA